MYSTSGDCGDAELGSGLGCGLLRKDRIGFFGEKTFSVLEDADEFLVSFP